MPIIDLQKRLSEAGRIRIGKTVPSGKGSRPTKLESFRFTTQSEAAAEMLASLYGGESKPWEGAPTGKQFEVISEADAVRVMVPPEAMGFSQHYELWKAGGCERRCDGNERSDGSACICDPENRECKPHTRLSVMLTDMPTSGLWRLDTSGYYAATELAGGFELARLIAQANGRSVLGATLRLEQREVKRPGATVKRFAVPVLDFDVDPRALIGEGSAERAALASPVTPVPALAAPSVQDQLQAVDEPNEKPRRANAAPEVKPTGLKPKGRVVEADESPSTPGKAVATPAADPIKPPSDLGAGADVQVDEGAMKSDPAGDLAGFFDSLKDGEAASLRWMVLRNHGWSTDEGNDVKKWAAKQTPEKLGAVFDDLLATREKAIAK